MILQYFKMESLSNPLLVHWILLKPKTVMLISIQKTSPKPINSQVHYIVIDGSQTWLNLTKLTIHAYQAANLTIIHS